MPSDRRHSRQSIPSQALKRLMQEIFRLLSRFSGRRAAEAGFVFPTTVLLVLMVTLTAGALTYRAYTRSNQVIVQRQQQVFSKAATPAVDRAKAKLEYLFSRDIRPAPKVPPSDALENLLRATSTYMLGGGNYDRLAIKPLANDIYTLEDETRLDIDGDGKADNAWMFTSDVNGDGTIDDDNEVVVYSLLVDHFNNRVGYTDKDEDKAKELVVRNSPLTTQANNPCLREDAAGEATVLEEPISGEGWSRINATKAQKTFQVDVFAADLRDANIASTVSTLEFQQIREASLANKWGAWFRYDLEVFPGPEFNWNGAMHTQGSLFLANDFNAYMISSTESCAYDPSASEITLGAENTELDFKGQLVRGFSEVGFNNEGGEGAPTVHVEDEADPKNPKIVTLDDKNDTVNSGNNNALPQIHLDPIRLFLDDESVHVSKADWTSDKEPEDAFPERIRNITKKEIVRISLDDAYRADNRYGPRKVYDPNEADNGRIPDGTKIGANITNNDLLTNEEAGLDGYWERRATREGTRLIVGQRLELGNPSGWNYNPRTRRIASRTTADNIDPLYPPNNLPTTRTGEHYKRKDLRDNLAAVQGMVVYHYETSGGRTPAACIAATSHFGTYDAIANSRTFRKSIVAGGPVVADFLTGRGTNGWEFDPVSPTTGDMSKALNNLAKFAGDPEGGAPSFGAVQEAATTKQPHPYPYLSMWGDFSMLNRVLAVGNDSIADKSTLDTAACTLALLAYNLDIIRREHNQVKTAGYGGTTYANLARALSVAIGYGYDVGTDSGNYGVDHDGVATTPQIGRTLAGLLGTDPLGTDPQVFPLDYWIDDSNGAIDESIMRAVGTFAKPTVAQSSNMKLLLNIGWHYYAAERDRQFGFNTSGLSGIAAAAAATGTYDAVNATYTLPGELFGDFVNSGANLNTKQDHELVYPAGTYKTYCNPRELMTAYSITQEFDALSLALAMCPGPHYPALYYIFPRQDHDVNGDTTNGDVQPADEEYVARALSPTLSFSAVDVSSIAATPKAAGSFNLPTFNAQATAKFALVYNQANTPDNRPWDVVVTEPDGAYSSAFGVSLLDKVVYLGRENSVARLLDINVAELMQGTNVSDTWFAGRDADENEHYGLTYAFREDATREDTVVRPTAGTSATCGQYSVYVSYSSANDNCYAVTAADVLDWTDPPLDTDHNISLKPVDYTPDPMRKPHGFRLRNGANFNRPDNVNSGLSFISDNLVAIQGDFNLHTQATTTPYEEEFDDPTVFDKDPEVGNQAKNGAYYKAFYERTANKVNEEFARASDDKWRPSEVLGDAVYLLSNSFVDGFGEAAYTDDAAGTGGTFKYEAGNDKGRVSFQNMNRPARITPNQRTVLPDRDDLYREGAVRRNKDDNDRLDLDVTKPAYYDRNGYLYHDSSGTAEPIPGDEYRYMAMLGTDLGIPVSAYRRSNLAAASDTTINALIISGVVPLRAGQSYGGLHNFPRFNESWDNKKLQIAGGFFQLFFSHTATGPFDMDAWEYNESSNPTDFDSRNIAYYSPPNRVWGYDVALQYAATPPISARFISVGATRDEFSREVPVDDPYVAMLKDAACKELGKNDGLCS